ncbi:IGF-like family receptor 1 isoform X1 [Protopterus annectens]|uniref:IGF-like family receptor 1 isoform X1 n=1 Tax=Protopterus annectens TaxID=7888 RepID=UPI001CF9FBA3|nr:IGF-like family receptor 1 isoform X1 [Protopterus annectens]
MHSKTIRQCDDGKYNDGTHELCQECTNCTSELLLKNCTKESNTLCCNPGEEKAPDGTCRNKNSIDEINTTKVPLGTQSISEKDNKHDSIEERNTFKDSHSAQWTRHKPGKDWITTVLVILAIVVIGTIFITVLIILQKRKRTSLCEENNESYAGDSNNPAAYVHFKCENQICDLEMIPLQKVLDNIDMLEELIMVLDPDVKNRKNTRHIAARYGLQANWIIYAYSRMDHYSPLKSVLEYVVSKNPDSTVQEFINILSQIGRNDAVKILQKMILIN